MRTATSALAISFLFISIASAPLRSQTTSQKPSFEVAVVKPFAGQRGGGINITPGGRFFAPSETLEGLIAFCYRVRDFQIIDGPGWMKKDLWEVEAKAPEGSVPPPAKFSLAQPEPPEIMTKPDSLDLMLQALIEDRFALRLHRTTMDLPVYEVLIAKGGPKIKLAEDQNPTTDRQQTPPPAVGANGVRAVLPGGYRIGGGPNGKQFEAKGLPLWVFANSLTNMMGIKVIDKTGLKGLYDWKLEWASDTSPTADPAGPSLFTAMQEQLGLRLVSTKGPVQVLVIDSVQKPILN